MSLKDSSKINTLKWCSAMITSYFYLIKESTCLISYKQNNNGLHWWQTPLPYSCNFAPPQTWNEDFHIQIRQDWKLLSKRRMRPEISKFNQSRWFLERKKLNLGCMQIFATKPTFLYPKCVAPENIQTSLQEEVLEDIWIKTSTCPS